MDTRVLGIIPAKAYSRRAPGKNMRSIAGRPLLDHTIAAAQAAHRLTRLCLTSEDDAILDHAHRAGLETVRRESALSADDVHASVPILDALERLGGADAVDFCVMLLPTFPLRRSTTIDAVIALADQSGDNVVSISALNKSVYHLRTLTEAGRARHITTEKLVNFQSQDVPMLYALNGCCYCAPTGPLLEERSFHYGDPMAHVTDHIEAWDIDTEEDFRIAEHLLEARG